MPTNFISSEADGTIMDRHLSISADLSRAELVTDSMLNECVCVCLSKMRGKRCFFFIFLRVKLSQQMMAVILVQSVWE